MTNKEFLKKLLNTHTPSGYETQFSLNEDSEVCYYPHGSFTRDNKILEDLTVRLLKVLMY